MTRRQFALQCDMFTLRPLGLSCAAPKSFVIGLSLLALGSTLGCRAGDAPPGPAQSLNVASTQTPAAPPPAPPEQKTTAERSVLDPGCPHQDGQSCNHEANGAVLQHQPTQWFGAPFTEKEAPEVSLDKVLADPQTYHDRDVIVSGQVRRACSRRGCWMEIASDKAGTSASCRVTFKDYGFLVPTDAKGSSARLLGKVQVTVTPQSAVQHYESEGATFANKRDDGSALEVRIVATGVELTRKS